MVMLNVKVKPVRQRRSPLFLKSVPNQRSMQVSAIIAMVLEADGKGPFDQDRTMGAGYHYSTLSIGNFLLAVANRLEAGTPSHIFTYDAAFVRKALGMTLFKLAGEIEKRTR